MTFDYLNGLTAETAPQGLEIGSPDLDTMRALADAEDFPGLLDLAKNLAGQQIFDIRVVFYAIYAETHEAGLLGLDQLFNYVSDLLTNKWSGLGPEDKRDRYAKSSLSWLFTHIRVDLQTVELEAGDTWKSWLQTFTHEDLGSLQRVISSLSHQLRNFGYGAVTGSVHLDILMKKLALFEQIMEQGDVAKAAIIVADIMETIEQFDPRLYLPSLFSRYFSLLTPKIGEIYELLEMRDTPQFQSLTSLYKVDMEAFFNLELNQ